MDRREHWHGRNGVFARSDANQSGVSLGTGLQGSAHRYRVVWSATTFEFYVDGGTVPAATLPYTTSGPLNVGGSDLTLSTPLLVELARRVALSGGRQLHLARVRCRQQRGLAAAQRGPGPAGQHRSGFEVRNGNVAVPDASWSSWCR